MYLKEGYWMKRTLCLLIALLCALPFALAQNNAAVATLKDETRQPWEPNNGSGFQRHWLLLGEFPAVIHQGMDRDFLPSTAEKQTYSLSPA
jgi:hypothetical protein